MGFEGKSANDKRLGPSDFKNISTYMAKKDCVSKVKINVDTLDSP